VCANTSEAAKVCNANHKSSSRLPFAGCPLRPRQTRPNRVAPQEKSNALYTVPFFPPSLTPHPRHPHPFSPSTAIPNSTQPKYKFACALPLFPSATCLCARANLCLTEAPKKRQMQNMRAGRLRASIFSQLGQVQGLLRCGRLSGITECVFFLTWRQGRWRWKRSGTDTR